MINILKQADIFYELTHTQLEMIASISTEKPFQEGDIIFEENSHSGTLYVIADGEVEIQVDSKLIGKTSGIREIQIDVAADRRLKMRRQLLYNELTIRPIQKL